MFYKNEIRTDFHDDGLQLEKRPFPAHLVIVID